MVRFESYKTALLIYLLEALSVGPSDTIPDPSWFIGRLPALLDATRTHELEWYPE